MKKITKTILLILIISLFLNTSCEVEKADCEKNSWGTLTIDNYLDDTYKIYVNAVYIGSVDAWGKKSFSNIEAGNHSIELKQDRLVLPNHYTKNVNVVPCETTTINLTGK